MRTLLASVMMVCLLPVMAWAANSENNFGGCGIDGVALPDGEIRVRQLVTGGPAHYAGIRVGDIITAIDGKATRGSDFRTMVQKRLRGVAGTPVVLKIRREGEAKPLTFKLTRRQLTVVQPREKSR
ncbi:MAG TPA: PDZ domain-containing protein [Desulfuromonadaceae bacterium]